MPDYATPEQWAQCEEWVNNPVVGATDACLLELRTRVSALEDDSWKQAESTRFCVDALVKRIEALEANSKPTPNPSQIRSSLVERVAVCLNEEGGSSWENQARAAIHEVLSYLCEHDLLSNYVRRELERGAKL